MSEALIYIIIFALIMFFMHRGHGGMGGCGGHAHAHDEKKPQPDSETRKLDEPVHSHHH